MIGTPELLAIGGILILFFGASKIPELAGSLGRAKRAFQDASRAETKKEDAP